MYVNTKNSDICIRLIVAVDCTVHEPCKRPIKFDIDCISIPVIIPDFKQSGHGTAVHGGYHT